MVPTTIQLTEKNAQQHVQSRKHRKFAQDDSNFLQLDFLLARVRRRTLQEVEDERTEQKARHRRRATCDSGDDDGVDCFLPRSPRHRDGAIRPWVDGDVDADGDVFVD